MIIVFMLDNSVCLIDILFIVSDTIFQVTVGFFVCFFFFQAEDGIRGIGVTGVQTCALPI